MLDLLKKLAWIDFFQTMKPSIQNMIYNMLEFHIPNTYIGPQFINLNICCGF